MSVPANSLAILQYEDAIKRFAQDPDPIPLAIPMSRETVIQRLHRAQVAELRDPRPHGLATYRVGEEPMDSGEASGL